MNLQPDVDKKKNQREEGGEKVFRGYPRLLRSASALPVGNYLTAVSLNLCTNDSSVKVGVGQETGTRVGGKKSDLASEQHIISTGNEKKRKVNFHPSPHGRA